VTAASGAAAPTVSVVIPTYNRLARLQRVLAALAAQTYPRTRFEVIVVSDGSTDGTDDYLDGDPPTELVFVAQPNSGPAVARNRGIKVASGSIVLFIDDDVIAAPQLIEQHVESHHRGGDGLAVIGPMVTPDDFDMCAWVRWEQTMLYRQYEAMAQGVYEPTPRQFYTGNASVDRASLLASGGFDARFRRAEDLDLAYRLDRAGLRFVFNPDAIGYHYADRPLESWLRNARDYGVCDAVFARDRGRDDVFEIVREGFKRRPALVRWATYACLARPRLASIAQTFFKGSYEVSAAAHAERAVRVSLSGLYNIAYYGGLADELGGGRAFRNVVNGSNRGRP
jgi:glycosyltransferase involved in cell wall biosynthesis